MTAGGYRYYMRSRGKVSGPFSLSVLREMRDRGQLGRFHELSIDQTVWAPAATFENLFPPALLSSPRDRPDRAPEVIPRPVSGETVVESPPEQCGRARARLARKL